MNDAAAKSPVISLMLAVPNTPAAVKWYGNALGARLLWSLGSVAGLEIRGAPFFLHESTQNHFHAPGEIGTTTVRVELFVDNPDEVIARAAAEGATGRHIENHTVPWGVHRQADSSIHSAMPGPSAINRRLDGSRNDGHVGRLLSVRIPSGSVGAESICVSREIVMNESWESYLCSINGRAGSIFVDLGAREMIDEAPPYLLKVRLKMKKPRADGLSSTEELESLYSIETDLRAVVAEHGARYVGRQTFGGHRYFFVYTAESEAQWDGHISPLVDRHHYVIAGHYKADPNHRGYREELYPSLDSWQVIKDHRVLLALRKQGDDGSKPRPVDHWAYFDTLANADQFATWLRDQGYVQVKVGPLESTKHSVHFRHEGDLRLKSITSRTIILGRKRARAGRRIRRMGSGRPRARIRPRSTLRFRSSRRLGAGYCPAH